MAQAQATVYSNKNVYVNTYRTSCSITIVCKRIEGCEYILSDGRSGHLGQQDDLYQVSYTVSPGTTIKIFKGGYGGYNSMYLTVNGTTVERSSNYLGPYTINSDCTIEFTADVSSGD